MELCDLNLFDFIHRSTQPLESVPFFIKDAPPPLKAQQIWNVMKHVTEGVNYLHTLNLVHRDLKPENSIILRPYTYSANNCIVLYSRKDSVWKLADFGYLTEATSSSLRMSAGMKGSEGYRAPELLNRNTKTILFNNKVDIWSLGCILHEFATGTKPFENDFDTYHHKVSNGTIRVVLDEAFSEQCKAAITTLVLSMLQIKLASRPSAAELLEKFSSLSQSSESNFNEPAGSSENLPIDPSATPTEQDVENAISELAVDRLILSNYLHLLCRRLSV